MAGRIPILVHVRISIHPNILLSWTACFEFLPLYTTMLLNVYTSTFAVNVNINREQVWKSLARKLSLVKSVPPC